MKIYSDNAVSSTDLMAVQQSVNQTVQSAVDAIDAKQNRQILLLQKWLVASFVVNVVLTIALKFL